MTSEDYPAASTCEALLRDGSVVSIRAIRPADALALETFHDRLTEETVYRRFFSFHPHLRAVEIAHFTRVDYANRFALVAESGHDIVGVARYDRTPDTEQAEVAFVVADQLQGQGLGTLLLEHLAAAAHRRGIAEFVAQTLATNTEMQEVFARTGFTAMQHSSDGVVDVSFRIDPSQRYLDAVVHRDWTTQHARGLRMFSSLGRGRLGVACTSAQEGNALAADLGRSAIEVSMLLVTDQLGIDGAEALAILATDPCTDVVALQLGTLGRPQTFLASARTASRRLPIVATGLPSGLAAQAGIELVVGGSAMVAAVRRSLMARQSPSWHPPVTGTLPSGDGLDVGAAHAVLAALPECAAGGPPALLDSHTAHRLLSCYGMSVDTSSEVLPVAAVSLTLSDRAGDGLELIRTGAGGGVPANRRLLPLTDLDLQVLMGDAAASNSDISSRIDSAFRLSRLIADQPQIRCIEASLAVGDGALVRASVWTGPPRGFEDDPFVRRLPSLARRRAVVASLAGGLPAVGEGGAVGRSPIHAD